MHGMRIQYVFTGLHVCGHRKDILSDRKRVTGNRRIHGKAQKNKERVHRLTLAHQKTHTHTTEIHTHTPTRKTPTHTEHRPTDARVHFVATPHSRGHKATTQSVVLPEARVSSATLQGARGAAQMTKGQRPGFLPNSRMFRLQVRG